MAVTITDPPRLTPDQEREAQALYLHLLALRRSGVRMAMVHLDDAIGVRPVNRRVDVARLTAAKYASTGCLE